MGTPSFSLALVWEKSCAPTGICELIQTLDRYFPRPKVFNVKVTLSEARACLLFSVDYALYSQRTLSLVKLEVLESGGRMVELLQLPEDKRAAFNAEFLLPARGASLHLRSLKDCAGPIREHLSKPPAGWLQINGFTHEPLFPRVEITAPPAPRWKSELPSRRRRPRFSCSMEVQLQAGNDFVHGLATNISRGGIFVCNNQHALDSRLCLKIQLPDGHLLQTKARVAHVLDQRPGGMGLAFNPDDLDFARELEGYF
jgi:hypothetical protein